jgi:hypothetical protein
MRCLAAIAAAIALVAFAAGCGGGGGSTASGSGSGDVTAEANAACAGANRTIAALPTPGDEAEVLAYLEATKEAVAKLQGEIAALGGDPDLEGYSQALAESVAILNEMANAARSRNPDGVRELSQGLVDLHVGGLARAAGLETCAEAPGAAA